MMGSSLVAQSLVTMRKMIGNYCRAAMASLLKVLTKGAWVFDAARLAEISMG